MLSRDGFVGQTRDQLNQALSIYLTDRHRDPKKFRLGALCKKNHRFQESDFSIRYANTTNNCLECKIIASKKDRARRQNKTSDLTPKVIAFLENCGAKSDSYTIGSICSRNHNFLDLGYSIRYKTNGTCIFCRRIGAKDRRDKNIDFWREYDRARYAQNPDRNQKCKERASVFYRKHKPKILAKLALQLATRTDEKIQKIREIKRKSHEKLYEQNREKKAQYRRNNPQYWYVYRDRKRTTREPYSKAQLDAKLTEFNNRCAYCDNEISWDLPSAHPRKLTWDHIHPLSRGGRDKLANLVPCCFRCNTRKHNILMEDWFRRQPFFCLKRLERIISVEAIHNPDEQGGRFN